MILAIIIVNMSKIDQKKSFYNRYHKQNSVFFKSISDNNFTYFLILKKIKQAFNYFNNRKLSVLDIGCGVGTIGFYIAEKGHTFLGIDISERAISIAKEYKKISRSKNTFFILGDVQSTIIRQKFDMVICTEVIEHLEKDEEMIKRINRLLKRNGILLLSTPSKNAPLFKLGLLRQFDKEVGHLRRYDQDSLTELLNNNGFKVLEFDKTEGILRNSLFTFKLLGQFIRIAKGPLVPFFHYLDRITVKLFGESDLILIAQKN